MRGSGTPVGQRSRRDSDEFNTPPKGQESDHEQGTVLQKLGSGKDKQIK